VQVIYGRWLIDGYPKVVLFDIATAMKKVDDWKQEIWSTSRIGIPWVDQEATDAVVFGFMTAIFLAEVRRRASKRRPVAKYSDALLLLPLTVRLHTRRQTHSGWVSHVSGG